MDSTGFEPASGLFGWYVLPYYTDRGDSECIPIQRESMKPSFRLSSVFITPKVFPIFQRPISGSLSRPLQTRKHTTLSCCFHLVFIAYYGLMFSAIHTFCMSKPSTPKKTAFTASGQPKLSLNECSYRTNATG